MGISPDKKEFISFKEKADKFFKVVSHWKTRMFFESINDKEFFNEINVIIDKVNSEISPEDMEYIFDTNMKKSKLYLEKSKNEQNFDEKFNLAMRAMAYFGISEALNEFSSFSEKVIMDIKEKYGEEYLKVIEELDKKFLSIDGKKFLKSKKIDIDLDAALKKYLVMKNVQDNQHYYYLEEIEPYIWKIEKEYLVFKSELNVFEQTNALILRALLEISDKKLINISELSKYYISGVKEDMIKIVGGKAYGLTILSSLDIYIPETHVIPINQDIKTEELEFFDKNKKYAIRSSANIEDGKVKSFAGMFDSYLDIDSNNIIGYIEKVKKSCNNPRLQAYMKENSILEKPEMAVIIQEYSEPDIAGVWMGSNEESGMLEWVKGSGEKLVSGKVTPENENWKDGNCDNEQKILIKEYPIGKKLIEYQKIILKNNLSLADFEWCVLNENLVMLQYRPVTKEISNIENTKSNENVVLNEDIKSIFHGVAASGGEVSTSAKFVNVTRESDKDIWKDGDILMAWYTDPEWMDVMIKSSGIVTAMGGFLCHAAIIARELGIPCVTGIGSDSMKKLWSEKFITVDGTKGEVIVKK